jgi:DNA-binding Xre family transcriptional regulator
MIRYNLDRAFKARGVTKPYAFLKRAGFSDSSASKLKNGAVNRMSLDTMENLCLLLHCAPNDLMEWTPDDTSKIEKDHPLEAIRRTDKVIDITKMLNSVPIQRLNELEQIIREKIEGKPGEDSTKDGEPAS